MAFISAFELSRTAKERDKQARAGRGHRLGGVENSAKNGGISSPPRLTILEEKTLAQTEAATLLDCVIGQWQREKIQSQD